MYTYYFSSNSILTRISLMLENGTWKKGGIITSDKSGKFNRQQSQFRNKISAAEKNRYHLYVSYACPWACRTLIFRMLKGLEDTISLSYVHPLMLENGWEFGQGEMADPLYGFQYLYQIYQTASPNYSGKVTVPVLWDKKTQTIVNNESSEIIRILNSDFNQFATKQDDYYPEKLRAEIDEINEFVYDNVNNGVYRCGFAQTQNAYEEAFDALFVALDKLENILSKHTYLVGDVLTEADWRLFTTLIRFDVVYFGHFKCNLRRIEDYPVLFKYLYGLYHFPGIKETVNFEHIKTHYYSSQRSINPTGIIPKGPTIHLD